MKLSELEVLNLHAQGGMAEVYRARVANPDGTEKIYAVKKILPHFTKEKELVRMFIEEARVAACLNCEQIVQVFDLVMSDTGEYFIVMEFADGKDLADVIYFAGQKKKRLPISMAVQVARDTLKALHYAYNAIDAEGRALRLVHRDVSPHNIIITYDGRVKLTDFGIAKVQASANKTMAGVIKGKFGYMSPEQARGKPLDGRSDLFNVGIVLYEAFTGDRLFQGASDLDTLDKMRAAMVPRLPTALGVPAELEALMRRALEREATNRPSDAASFERELAGIAQKHSLLAQQSEIVATMREVFPAETQSKDRPVVQTRHVDLKSQLFRDGAPAIQAARPPPPGSAAARAAQPPAQAPAQSPPASALPESVRAADALPSQRPKGGGAAVRAGGGARALDEPAAASVAPVGEAGTRVEPHDEASALAHGTHVEPAAPGLRSVPPSGSGARPDGARGGVVAASAQVRALPLDGPPIVDASASSASSPSGAASAPRSAPDARPAPPEPPTLPPETVELSPATIAMVREVAPPPAAFSSASAPPPPPAAFSSASSPPPPPAAFSSASSPPPPPASIAAAAAPPPPAGLASASAPPPTPSSAAQPAVRVASLPSSLPSSLASSRPVRRPAGLLSGPGLAAAVSSVALVGALVGAALALALPEDGEGADLDQRTVMIRTTPPGATVLFDGDPLGVAPLVTNRRLVDGVHTVKLTGADGGSVSRKVQVKEDERAVLINVNLLTTGTVLIETIPPGARISLDSKEVGKSPVTVERVGTDRERIVEAILDGYIVEQATVPTDRPAEYRVTLPLASMRGDGQLVIDAAPVADVELDGIPWGRSGPKPRACAPGPHKVVLKAPGMPPSATYTVQVRSSATAQYYFDLSAGTPGTRL